MTRYLCTLAFLSCLACLPAMAVDPGLHDVEALVRVAPFRNMGSSCREDLDRHIAERFRATGLECGQIAFPTVAFVPGKAELILPDGLRFPLHSLKPNSAHPGNIPGGVWTGRLVDLGRCDRERLGACSPADAAVLLDMDSGRAWSIALELGASAIIFVGGPEDSARQAGAKLSFAPLSVPRFYLTPADGAALRQALARSSPGRVTLKQHQPNQWKAITAVNHWVIVPGTTHRDKVVHVQAYKDADCIVPALASGAESLCNLALMLRLLDRCVANPPQCTTVFSAVSDHCNAFRGEQFFIASTYSDPDALAEEREQREQELADAELYAQVYGDTSAANIRDIRLGNSRRTGRSISFKVPILRELQYRHSMTLHDITLAQTRLRRADLSEADRARCREEKDRLEKYSDELVLMMNVFQRWQRAVTFDDLPEARKAEVVALMREIAERYRRQVDDARAALDQINANGRLAELLAAKRTHLYLTLDLTFGGESMGFFYNGADGGPELPAWITSVSPLANLSVKVAGGMPDGERYFTDTIRNTGGVGWRSHLGDKFGMAAAVGNAMLQTSVTLSTTADTRERVFTPGDTLENLDKPRAGRMLDFAQRFLLALLADEAFPEAARPARARNYRAMTFRLNLRRLDPYSVEIPDRPVQSAVVVVRPFNILAQVPPVRGQVAACQLALTDRQGSALFRGCPPVTNCEAYAFTPGFGAIAGVIDAGSGGRRIPPVIRNPGNNWSWDTGTALLFDAVQTDLVGLYNPQTRAQTAKITLLDGVRESSPDHYGIAGVPETAAAYQPILADEGVACIFTEKDLPFKILADDFLLLNCVDAPPDHPNGIGYLPGDSRLRTVTYTSARDVQKLNGLRYERIMQKGVTNAAAKELHTRAGRLIDEAEAGRARGSQMEFFSKSIEGLSSSLRSYTAVKETTTDLIKAVAVFLALVIPFCLFLTRLVSPWTDIRARIAAFGAVFIVMAGGLMLLHPAFSLSQTPMMVLLAFVMVGLAVFVMLILYTRLDAGLKRMAEDAQGIETGDGTRKALAGVAFSVGINNMRRRRLRTTLTAVTIVLVTFTMLSVISVDQSLSPYRRRTESAAPYNGVLFAKAGMGPIADSTMLHVVSLLEPYARDADKGGGRVVRRTWTQRLDAFGDYQRQSVARPEAPEKALFVKSALGVEVGEDGFIAPMPIVAGRWFRSNDAREIILSVTAASYLGITPQSFVECDLEFRSRTVRLVGLLDDDRLAAMRDLARLTLLPLESLPDPVTRLVSETGEMKVSEQDAAQGPAPAARALAPQDCALLPIFFAMQLPDTSYRSVALKAPCAQTAWDAATHFVGATDSLTYVSVSEAVAGRKPDGARDGTLIEPAQYSLSKAVGSSVGGVGKVVIPICLAATIILNTMLGSVMERRKEIAVFNSIGLNPTHVFMFFVAEAVVFGVIGSVAGYLVGQGLALSIVKLGLLKGINLNYSSMAIMVVIFAVILTVVVSTLYPAWIATRAAVPSGQRRWRLPPTSGDTLRLDLPFSYSEEQLPCALAYLHAFMDLNSEASSGQFLAQDSRFGHVYDVDGKKVLTLLYNVTPVPFDLGVNQRVEVYGYYQPKVRAYVVAIHITRLAGDRSSWLTVNQAFLESLRARLLSWRSQPSARQEHFCAQGQALFADARELPVVERATP